MTTHVTPTGVTYEVTNNLVPVTSKVTIKDANGNTIYSGSLVPTANIITPTSSSSITIASLLAGGTYIVTPNVTNGLITIGASILALTGNTFYIGGTATLNILASAFSSLDIHVDGGNLTLTSGSVLTAVSNNNIELSYGGTLTINQSILNVLSKTTITFGSGGGTFIGNSGNLLVNLSGVTFQNFDPKLDVIELINANNPIASYTIAGTGNSRTITLFDSSGKVISNFILNLASGVTLPIGNFNVNGSTANPLSISYSNGDNFMGNCFLAGSMIHTPTGNVPVETLQADDKIIGYINGKEEIRTVVWAGWKNVTVRSDYPDDQAGYPIRIKKNAIAENVPYKDMLITAEHCLFFDGKFVPARMLVNNVSIFYDYSIISYTYYHIETEKHSVIMADGVLTESYLDTGNRHLLNQKDINTPVSICNRNLTWEYNAAAPLDVTKDFVEPIFYSIISRLDHTLGKNKVYSSYEITMDNDFHLITNTGAILYPTSIKDRRYEFSLSDHITSVRLVSRSSRPFDAVGPFVDDRRYLGLLIGKILLQQSDKTIELNEHFERENLDGWYAKESNNHRWTDGNAFLPLSHYTIKNNSRLIVQVESANIYIKYDVKHKDCA